MRYRDLVDGAVPKVANNLLDRRIPPLIELEDLRKVCLGEAIVAKGRRFDGEDHETPCDSSHLVETTTPISPVMKCEHRERCVEGPAAKRQRFSRGPNNGGRPGHSLLDHAP